MVARALLIKHEVEYYLETLRIFYGFTHRIVADIEKYGLTEAEKCNIDDYAVIAADEPDEKELQILNAKERVRYKHIVLREKWHSTFGSDEPMRRWPRSTLWSSTFSKLPVWEEIYYTLNDNTMRCLRNMFAHGYICSSLFENKEGEAENFRWLHKTYAELNPFLKALIKKLQDALDDQDHWVEDCGEAREQFTDLEYAKDLPESEASWAAATEARMQELRAEILLEQESVEILNELPFCILGEEEEEEDSDTPAEGEENKLEPISDDTKHEIEETNGDNTSRLSKFMDFALRKFMELIFKVRFVRRAANAFGQKLWEMQGDSEPSTWIETGNHYHYEAPTDYQDRWCSYDNDHNAWTASAVSPAVEDTGAWEGTTTW